MTPEQNHQLLTTLFKEKLLISKERLLPTARLQQDLGLDSLDLQLLGLDIEAAIEDHYQIEGWEITDEQMTTAETYQDLLNLLPQTTPCQT